MTAFQLAMKLTSAASRPAKGKTFKVKDKITGENASFKFSAAPVSLAMPDVLAAAHGGITPKVTESAGLGKDSTPFEEVRGAAAETLYRGLRGLPAMEAPPMTPPANRLTAEQQKILDDTAAEFAAENAEPSANGQHVPA